MKRFGFQVAVVTVGVLLGWLAASLSGGLSSPAAAGSRDGSHFSAASPETPSTISESTKVDPAEENVRLLVPGRQDTPWLKPVLMGIGALFLGAVVVGVAARRMGVQDPGTLATEQDRKDAESGANHEEQPLDATADPHAKSAHH